MKIELKYGLVPIALIAAVFLAGCDRERGEDASTASDTTTVPSASQEETAAGTQDEAYTSATAPVDTNMPVDPNAGGTTNPMGDSPDAPMTNDPNSAPTQGSQELREREQDQHMGKDPQDGTHGDSATNNGNTPNP